MKLLFSISFLSLIFCFNVNSQEDSLILSQPFIFTEWVGVINLYRTTSLTSTKFIIAYDKGGTENGKVRVGNIVNDSTIEYGNEFNFSSDINIHNIEIKALSSTEFIMAYNDSYTLRIKAGIINGNIITFYSGIIYLYGSCSMYSINSLSPTKFLLSYIDPNNSRGKSAIGLINENEITIEESYQFTSYSISNTTYMSMDTLSNSKFIVTWGYSGGFGVIGSISGSNEITFGDITQFQPQSEGAYYPNVLATNNSEFVISYVNDYTLRIGKILLGSVINNDQIIFGDEFSCTPSHTATISMAKLNSNKFVIGYSLFISQDPSFVNSFKLIDGNVILNNEIFNDSISGFNVTCGMDSTNFILAYYNPESFIGYTKVGGMYNFELPSSYENFIEPKICLLPNPSSHFINISLGTTDEDIFIQIVSLSGQIMYEKKYESLSNIKIDISGLNMGIYLIKINNGELIFSEKLVKL